MKQLLSICFFVCLSNVTFSQDEFISSLYFTKTSYLKDSAAIQILTKNFSVKKNSIRIKKNDNWETYSSDKIYGYKHRGRTYVYHAKKQKFLVHIVKMDELNVYVEEGFFPKSFYTIKEGELVRLKKKNFFSDVHLNDAEKMVLKEVRKKEVQREMFINTRTVVGSFLFVCTLAYFGAF
jgi:hypothetical protein